MPHTVRMSPGCNGGGRGRGDLWVKSSWYIKGDNDDDDWLSDTTINNDGLRGETEKS